MDKKILIILIIIGIAVLAAWGLIRYMSPTPPPVIYAPPPAYAPREGAAENDSTAAINRELESITVNDIDSEFQSIDSDINSL
jgi:hypothetical protein